MVRWLPVGTSTPLSFSACFVAAVSVVDGGSGGGVGVVVLSVCVHVCVISSFYIIC